MQIIGAHSGFGRLMARLMKLPPAGERLAASLHVVHRGNVVIWSRCFGTLRLSSAQVVRKSSFVERAGPFGFVIQPVAAMDALIFRQVGFRVFGLPFPQWLGPRIQGKVASGASDTSWDVDVTIDSRLGGCLCRYFGTMTAQ